MSTLHAIEDGLWVVRADSSFIGLELGTRMTVVRLPDGGLLLHSPVPFNDALRGALDELGPVRGIVAPNLYHHMYVGEFANAYPKARVFAAPGLARKRQDLRIDGVFDESGAHPWSDVLPSVSIHGSLLRETVLLHQASRTLISCDLLENYQACPHWGTRQYIKLMGLWQKPGIPRWLRLTYRDRPAARASIDRVLALDFDRLIVAHGDVVESRGKEILADSYGWLKGSKSAS